LLGLSGIVARRNDPEGAERDPALETPRSVKSTGATLAPAVLPTPPPPSVLSEASDPPRLVEDARTPSTPRQPDTAEVVRVTQSNSRKTSETSPLPVRSTKPTSHATTPPTTTHVAPALAAATLPAENASPPPGAASPPSPLSPPAPRAAPEAFDPGF
jgi:hypothetical protein